MGYFFVVSSCFLCSIALPMNMFVTFSESINICVYFVFFIFYLLCIFSFVLKSEFD